MGVRPDTSSDSSRKWKCLHRMALSFGSTRLRVRPMGSRTVHITKSAGRTSARSRGNGRGVMGQPLSDPALDEYRKAQEEEYGTWVAATDIFAGTALAYIEGDAVPKSNVERFKYDTMGL